MDHPGRKEHHKQNEPVPPPPPPTTTASHSASGSSSAGASSSSAGGGGGGAHGGANRSHKATGGGGHHKAPPVTANGIPPVITLMHTKAYLNTLPSSNSAGGQYSNIQYPHIQFPAASGGAAGAAGTGQVLFAAQSGDHISFQSITPHTLSIYHSCFPLTCRHTFTIIIPNLLYRLFVSCIMILFLWVLYCLLA